MTLRSGRVRVRIMRAPADEGSGGSGSETDLWGNAIEDPQDEANEQANLDELKDLFETEDTQEDAPASVQTQAAPPQSPQDALDTIFSQHNIGSGIDFEMLTQKILEGDTGALKGAFEQFGKQLFEAAAKTSNTLAANHAKNAMAGVDGKINSRAAQDSLRSALESEIPLLHDPKRGPLLRPVIESIAARAWARTKGDKEATIAQTKRYMTEVMRVSMEPLASTASKSSFRNTTPATASGKSDSLDWLSVLKGRG